MTAQSNQTCVRPAAYRSISVGPDNLAEEPSLVSNAGSGELLTVTYVVVEHLKWDTKVAYREMPAGHRLGCSSNQAKQRDIGQTAAEAPLYPCLHPPSSPLSFVSFVVSFRLSRPLMRH